MELLIIIGYILWVIFISECLNLDDKDVNTYCTCVFTVPVPAFLLVYLLAEYALGIKDDDTNVFAMSISAAYTLPLCVYIVVQLFKLLFNKIVEFIKRVREHRRLVRECEKMSELAKQEEIRRRKQKIYHHLAKQMANCSTPRANF